MSTQALQYRALFSNTLNQLISYLESIFPGDAELGVFRFGFDAINQRDPDMLVSSFLMHGYKHKDQIIAKNLAFFYQNADTIAEQSGADNSADLVGALRSKVDRLDDAQRDRVWKYLEGLVLLTERYVAARMV